MTGDVMVEGPREEGMIVEDLIGEMIEEMTDMGMIDVVVREVNAETAGDLLLVDLHLEEIAGVLQSVAVVHRESGDIAEVDLL